MSFDRAARTYGTRARIGMIVPPTNTVNEAEWACMVPAGVSLHATRMPLHDSVSTEAGVQQLLKELASTVPLLSAAEVDVMAYCCTAGSLVSPLERITDFMSAASGGVPSVATGPALVRACRAMGVGRVSLATPYHDALNAHEAAFLEQHGIQVVAMAGLGIGAGGPHEYKRIARVCLAEVIAHAESVDHHHAQALLISCTDLATLDAIGLLERRLRKPVITSNQATLWAALTMCDVPAPMDAAGSLFSTRGPLSAGCPPRKLGSTNRST